MQRNATIVAPHHPNYERSAAPLFNWLLDASEALADRRLHGRVRADGRADLRAVGLFRYGGVLGCPRQGAGPVASSPLLMVRAARRGSGLPAYLASSVSRGRWKRRSWLPRSGRPNTAGGWVMHTPNEMAGRSLSLG